MKSPKSVEVPVIVTTALSNQPIPNFIKLMHRHLEKEGGEEKVMNGGKGFTAPLDLMRMMVPPTLVDEVEEITLVYQK